jgi:hypothetical protein
MIFKRSMGPRKSKCDAPSDTTQEMGLPYANKFMFFSQVTKYIFFYKWGGNDLTPNVF